MTATLETARSATLVAVIAVASVLALTTLGAFASRRFGFPYGRLAFPTLFVYLLLGFFVQVALDEIWQSFQIVILAAALDVTAGYWIVARIGPPRAPARRWQLALGAVLALVSQAAIGFVGATWLLYGVIILLRMRH